MTMQELNKVKQIHTNFKQSIWLDFIDRQIMRSGKLQQLIDEDGIRGVTSNPAIFEQAISSSADYDADILEYAQTDSDPEHIFFRLAISDIQQAADLFAPVYNEEVSGADGYVSLEVSPLLALDETGTTEQARELWKKVDRRNVMIKIPGTLPGLPAIRTAISEGININVTLLFGLERYQAVANAYINGLEDRLSAGLDISRIASVASFFLSRIDLLVDPLLDDKDLGEMKGEAAIAAAKAAYALYKRLFSGERWDKLALAGAKPQRLLWASTGNKNPAYRDTRYIEELIGPDTVNTAPLATIDAFRDHGTAAAKLHNGTEQALHMLESLAGSGINMREVAEQLEKEGIQKFEAPYQKLLQAIKTKIQQQTTLYQPPMENTEKSLDVINDLIKINNDRSAGFEKAGKDLKEDENGLTAVFSKLSNESIRNVNELTVLARQFGGEAAEGTSTSGDLHRTWIDIKSAFTGNDLSAILNECERGEDAAKSAYKEALDPENELNPEVEQVLINQQRGIVEGHDLIKSLRDQATNSDNYDNNPNDNDVATEAFDEDPAGVGAYAPESETVIPDEEWDEDQASATGNSKLAEFFVNELKDLLWAENKLVDTLPEMAEAATSAELKSAFEQHLTETEEHVERLEQIFDILGIEPDSRKCEAMAGIVDEGDEIISATEEGTAQRDVGLIFAGQKAEHYEIASYGGMIALAKTLGYYEVAELLVLTLDEEKTADALLTEIAESQANLAASNEPAED